MIKRRKTALLSGLAALMLAALMAGSSRAHWEVPVALPADEFGTILISRTSEYQGV
jgi:hypothetical protein